MIDIAKQKLAAREWLFCHCLNEFCVHMPRHSVSGNDIIVQKDNIVLLHKQI